MDITLRSRVITTIHERGPGITFRDVSKRFDIPLEMVSQIYNDYKVNKIKDYYERNGDRLRKCSRERGLRTMYVDGIRIHGVRREKPNTCELCDSNVKLVYHHWDNSELERGVWVCHDCHVICELSDGYHGNRRDLQSKYIELKENVNLIIASKS